jgi:uncharacterized protein YegP (UPF0339 family)
MPRPKKQVVAKEAMPKVTNPQHGTLEVYQAPMSAGDKGTWRWRLKAGNGRVVANGAEAYVNHADVMQAAANMLDYDMTEVKIVEVAPEPAPVRTRDGKPIE